jgi:predicted amidophosphoribosyltransferase
VAYEGPVARAIQRFKYQKDFLLTASLAWVAEHYPWEPAAGKGFQSGPAVKPGL